MDQFLNHKKPRTSYKGKALIQRVFLLLLLHRGHLEHRGQVAQTLQDVPLLETASRVSGAGLRDSSLGVEEIKFGAVALKCLREFNVEGFGLQGCGGSSVQVSKVPGPRGAFSKRAGVGLPGSEAAAAHTGLRHWIH